MIADMIKSLRQKSHMTQSDLARKLNITRSSVNAWEMGISVPSTQYMVELARIFRVSTDVILGVTDRQVLDITDLTEDQTEILFMLVRHFVEENARRT